MEEQERRKKTIQEAETSAFTTQFFYFTMKVLFIYIICHYKTILVFRSWETVVFTIILIINAYMMLTTGNTPGFEIQENYVESSIEEEGESFVNNENTFCSICKCKKKIRTKHCFRCGKCVRKYDHHCPWIGSCVGEANHFRFCLLTLFQTIQSISAFLLLYEYREGEDFGQEFGVFAIFSMLMFFYVLFVGCLFVFHAYLILTNATTNELMKRGKVWYLKEIKGNPFAKGPINNIKMAIDIPIEGQEECFYPECLGNS